jgi:hypothetical protein
MSRFALLDCSPTRSALAGACSVTGVVGNVQIEEKGGLAFSHSIAGASRFLLLRSLKVESGHRHPPHWNCSGVRWRKKRLNLTQEAKIAVDHCR